MPALPNPVAFVGLGTMGGPMAINLASRVSVLAYDSNDATHQQFSQSTIKIVDHTEELANAQLVFLCVPNGDIVEDVLFGNHGLATRLQPGTTVVDTSTIDHATTLKVHSKLSELNVNFIDAPVSGMQSRAEDGTLTMMCGGDADLVESIKPLLLTMASKVIHMGPVGSGQLTKLINQLLFDINAAALAEILPMAAKLGLDPDNIGAVVNSGTGRSYASEFFIPHILNNEFGHGYPMDHAYKDLVNASEISATHKFPTPLLSAATATYQTALNQGHGAKDKGGMICVFEDLLGVKFRSAKTKHDAE